MRTWRAALVHAALAALILPVLPLLIWSFTEAWPWPGLLPTTFSLRAWRVAADADAGFLSGLAASCALAAVVTVISLAISLPLAELLGRGRFRGKAFVEVLAMLPLFIPAFVAAMGLHETLIHWGLADTYAGVALLQLVPTTPYMVRSLATGFALLGTRLEDQARTLGAGPWQVFSRITLPRLVPAIVLGSTFVFLASLGEYLLALLVGGGAVRTLPIVLYPFLASGDRAISSMGSLLLYAGPLVVLLVIDLKTRKYV